MKHCSKFKLEIVEENNVGVSDIIRERAIYFHNHEKLVFLEKGRVDGDNNLNISIYHLPSNSLKTIAVGTVKQISRCHFFEISEDSIILSKFIYSKDPEFEIISIEDESIKSSLDFECSGENITCITCIRGKPINSAVKVNDDIFLCGLRSYGKILKISLSEKRMCFLEIDFCSSSLNHGLNSNLTDSGLKFIVLSKKNPNIVFVNFSQVSRHLGFGDVEFEDSVGIADHERERFIKHISIITGEYYIMKNMTTFLSKTGNEILITLFNWIGSEILQVLFHDVETSACIRNIETNIVSKSYKHIPTIIPIHCSNENGYLFIGGEACVCIFDLVENIAEYHLNLSGNSMIDLLIPLEDDGRSFFCMSASDPSKIQKIRIHGLRKSENRFEVANLTERISFLCSEKIDISLRFSLCFENISLDNLPRIFFLL